MLNPLMSRERVVVADRPSLSKTAKARIWTAGNGLCALCGKPVPPDGPGVQFDHDTARELGGSDDESNLRAVHTRCHAAKTAGEDIPRIAKARRQEKLTKAKVQKRGGFSGWRRFDGTIVKRNTNRNKGDAQ
jgi:5-methylcytosine-specific restriction protein A